jgi:hypothetical protein
MNRQCADPGTRRSMVSPSACCFRHGLGPSMLTETPLMRAATPQGTAALWQRDRDTSNTDPGHRWFGRRAVAEFASTDLILSAA